MMKQIAKLYIQMNIFEVANFAVATGSCRMKITNEKANNHCSFENDGHLPFNSFKHMRNKRFSLGFLCMYACVSID